MLNKIFKTEKYYHKKDIPNYLSVAFEIEIPVMRGGRLEFN